MVKKKVNHKREEKMHSKVKMTSQRAENLVHMQQHRGKHYYKKNVLVIWFFLADIAIWMSNSVNFDIDQIPSKLAQRKYFVSSFCCKNFFIQGSLDDAENSKWYFFMDDPLQKSKIEE